MSSPDTLRARHALRADHARPRGTHTPHARRAPIVARCHAATDAASRISFQRPSAPPQRPRNAARSVPPRSPRAPAARVRVPSPATRRRTGRSARRRSAGGRAAPSRPRAAPSPRPVRRARGPRATRRRLPTRPAGTPRTAAPTGCRNCSISHTCPSSIGTISADGGFSTQRVEPGCRPSRAGPRAPASSGSHRRRGSRRRARRTQPRLRRDDLRRDPRALPELLRGPRPQAHPLRQPRAGRARSVGAAHDRGHAPAQAVLPGPREAAAPPADELPEVLPHAGHRPGRHDDPPPDVLRDARQLLDGRLLQAGRRRVRVGAVARGLRLQPRRHLGHGLRGRRGARRSGPTRRRSRRG